MPNKLALDFLEFCEQQNDAAVIERRFVSTLQAMGYEYVACASHIDPLRPRPGAVSVVTYPAPWLQQYEECDLARIDPVFLAACMRTSLFHWREALSSMSLNRQQKRMLEEGASYGVRDGLTIPLRSLDMIPASCSLVAGPDGVDPLLLPSTLMIVISGHSALYRRLNPGQARQPVVLPPRERDCLSLAGRGKSDWVMGQLLNLSPRTVHNVLERTKKRYGVSSRPQAIIQAVFDGQISVDDLAD